VSQLPKTSFWKRTSKGGIREDKNAGRDGGDDSKGEGGIGEPDSGRGGERRAVGLGKTSGRKRTSEQGIRAFTLY